MHDGSVGSQGGSVSVHPLKYHYITLQAETNISNKYVQHIFLILRVAASLYIR